MQKEPYTSQPRTLSALFDKPIQKVSPVNADNLEGQNKRLYEHLASGNTISFLEAREMGIDQLSGRIKDLTKRGIKIKSSLIRIGGTQCKEYSLGGG